MNHVVQLSRKEKLVDACGYYANWIGKVIHVVEYPKCGGTWLLKMLKTALDIKLRGDDELFLPFGNVVKRHVQFDRRYLMPVMVVRDPRDVLVSYFFHETSHRPSKAVMENIHYDPEQPIAHNMFNYIRLKTEQPTLTYPFFSYDQFVDDWMGKRKSMTWVRYEDLHTRPVHELRRIFSTFGFSIADSRLEEAVAANTFKQMSGGRSQGEEDTSSHRRKGIVGDWHSYFTDEMCEYVQHSYHQFFSRFGYQSLSTD